MTAGAVPYVGSDIALQKSPMTSAEPDGHQKPALSPEAERALAEAAERRRAADEAARNRQAPREVNGPNGPEPTRYGDWEKKGIVSDF